MTSRNCLFLKKKSTYIVVASSEVRGSYIAIDCWIGASNPSMNGYASFTRGIKIRGSQRIEILENNHLTSGWIARGVKDENDFFCSIKWLLFAQLVRIQVDQMHSSSCVGNERPSVNLIVDCDFLLNFEQWSIFSWQWWCRSDWKKTIQNTSCRRFITISSPSITNKTAKITKYFILNSPTNW